MKKYILLIITAFILVACGAEDTQTNEVGEIESDEVEKEIETLTELDKDMILDHMDLIISDYMLAVVHEEGSQERTDQLNDALEDINSTELDIEENYEEGTPEKQDLLGLVEITRFAVEEEIAGNFENSDDNAQKVSEVIAAISGVYLDGELPATIQAITGQENVYE